MDLDNTKILFTNAPIVINYDFLNLEKQAIDYATRKFSRIFATAQHNPDPVNQLLVLGESKVIKPVY